MIMCFEFKSYTAEGQTHALLIQAIKTFEYYQAYTDSVLIDSRFSRISHCVSVFLGDGLGAQVDSYVVLVSWLCGYLS